MRKSLFLIASLLVLILTGAMWQTVSAYKVNRTSAQYGSKMIKWSSKKMTYKVNLKGAPATALSAIKAAAAAWTNVTSCPFKFVYGGKSTSTNHTSNDGINLVNFANMGSTSVLAQNLYFYYPSTGYMAESNIQFNTYYKWSTNLASGTYDVRNVGTHEFGHSLSLADLYGSADKQKTMYGYCSKRETKKRSLTSDDIAGIRYLY